MAINLVTKYQPYVDEIFTKESKNHSSLIRIMIGQERTQSKYIRSQHLKCRIIREIRLQALLDPVMVR